MQGMNLVNFARRQLLIHAFSSESPWFEAVLKFAP